MLWWAVHGWAVHGWAVLGCLVAKLCLTLWDPMDSYQWDSLGKDTGVGCYVPLQGIFWTRDRTCISCLVGRFLTSEPPGKPIVLIYLFSKDVNGTQMNLYQGIYQDNLGCFSTCFLSPNLLPLFDFILFLWICRGRLSLRRIEWLVQDGAWWWFF